MSLSTKKGSVIILLVLTFAALIILIFSIVRCSIDKGIYSCAESLGRVWSISLMGEYDKHLNEDYGILAFYGDENTVTSKINKYAKATYKGKKYIDYQGSVANLYGYKLADPNVFQKAIGDSLKIVNNRKNSSHVERIINSEKILLGLPSRQSSSNTLKKDKRGKTLLYAFSHFNNHNKCINSKSYFANEIEYLIGGKSSDEKNLNKVKRLFIETRTIANSSYIYTHEEMIAAVTAIANVLTPGPEAEVTKLALIETWALLESKNDWEILMHKGKVPLNKTKESWALDESVLTDKEEDGYVDTNCKSGLEYEDYLMTLAMTRKESVLLFRMMDLIQINMKYNYYRDFLICEYNTGLDCSIYVNGERHDFSQEY